MEHVRMGEDAHEFAIHLGGRLSVAVVSMMAMAVAGLMAMVRVDGWQAELVSHPVRPAECLQAQAAAERPSASLTMVVMPSFVMAAFVMLTLVVLIVEGPLADSLCLLLLFLQEGVLRNRYSVGCREAPSDICKRC